MPHCLAKEDIFKRRRDANFFQVVHVFRIYLNTGSTVKMAKINQKSGWILTQAISIGSHVLWHEKLI